MRAVLISRGHFLTGSCIKDHIDRDIYDAVAEISEENAIANTLTADAVSGDGDGTFTYDPMHLTDDHRGDSGYTSGANRT